ncbi:MAG: hypothetical protein FJX77_06740, partial [Armatimonadetes bacterium]|nr:hypothetical protein [Armatimonadota bacterium]
MTRSASASVPADPDLAHCLVVGILAGGMGWGIRGQYGHQTGAMMAGLLVCLGIGALLGRPLSSLQMARAVALGAIGMAFGGSQTYGQTVGLTHDAELRGNWPALAWGMAGLALKGALWVGFSGALLGMGLSRVRYRAREIALLFWVLIALMLLGMALLNQPYDLEQRRLPLLYFSATWDWFPNKPDLRPRFENWGGLFAALAALVYYVARVRRDRLAGRLALFGIGFGALGFPLGQSIQAWHAWNPALFRQDGPLSPLDTTVNWWNTMEITFGAVLGGGLALGAWCGRSEIGPKEGEAEPALSAGLEWLWLGLHPALLIAWEFQEFRAVEGFAGLALPFWAMPVLAVLLGRRFPYALCLPLVALPIAGKTLREMCYKSSDIAVPLGWILFAVLPLVLLSLAARAAYRRAAQGEPGEHFAARTLILAA